LRKPESFSNHNFEEFDKMEKKVEERYHLKSQIPVYEALYDTEKLGSCEYKQYNFKRTT
jgi:hypothetical protein